MTTNTTNTTNTPTTNTPTIYRTLVLTHQTKPIYLKEADILEHVPGGINLIFASSPSTTTFYPYHRIREIETVDSSKRKPSFSTFRI